MSELMNTVLFMCSKNKQPTPLLSALEDINASVSVFDDADDAFHAQSEKPFDIVVTEYELDDTNGTDFLKKILSINSSSTRIVVGEKINEQLIIKSVIKGIAGAYISDVNSSELLKQKIEDIIRVRNSVLDKKFSAIDTKSNDIPINMSVYEKLMDAINADAPLPVISKIISRDVSLTAQVLQVANSAFYGNFSGTSIEKAILYMGLSPVKDIVLLHSLTANLNMSSSQNKELEDIVRHSVNTNYYMHAISQKAKCCQITSLNNSVGIIHDIGKLIQLVYFPMEFTNISHYRKDNPEADYFTSENETENLDVKHTDIGAYYLKNWNFNQYSVEAALFHHEPEESTQEMKPCVESLFLANTLADIRDGYDLSLEDALERCEIIKLSPEDIYSILPPM